MKEISFQTFRTCLFTVLWRFNFSNSNDFIFLTHVLILVMEDLDLDCIAGVFIDDFQTKDGYGNVWRNDNDLQIINPPDEIANTQLSELYNQMEEGPTVVEWEKRRLE